MRRHGEDDERWEIRPGTRVQAPVGFPHDVDGAIEAACFVRDTPSPICDVAGAVASATESLADRWEFALNARKRLATVDPTHLQQVPRGRQVPPTDGRAYVSARVLIHHSTDEILTREQGIRASCEKPPRLSSSPNVAGAVARAPTSPRWRDGIPGLKP